MASIKLKLKSPSERTAFKNKVTSLADITWTEKSEQYCAYRLDGTTAGGWVRIKQYTNGTLYVEASSEDNLALVEPCLQDGQMNILPPKEKKAKTVVEQVSFDVPYVGTDESGKGDYFGPLVIAGALVTPEHGKILETLGVMDSKALKDQQIGQLAKEIKQVLGESATSVIAIGNKRYNELYNTFKSSGKNLNHMLAWGHATAIENILKENPDCQMAVADQFGNERYILSQLKTLGKQIKLHQQHRAEAHVGVAAASILARERFVSQIRRMSNQYGVELPLGASQKVLVAAKRVVAQHGPQKLGEVAKLHFKTTETVLK